MNASDFEDALARAVNLTGKPEPVLSAEQWEPVRLEFALVVERAWERIKVAVLPAVTALMEWHETAGHDWRDDRPLGHLTTYPRCTTCRRWHPDAPTVLRRTRTRHAYQEDR